MRRVVMGEPAPGKGAFTHVEEVEAVYGLAAAKVWYLWGFDETPRLPHQATEPYTPRSWFPAPGGMRLLAIQHDESIESTPEGSELHQRMAGAELAGVLWDPDRAGMHRTNSIDIGVVVSGEMITEAEDGSTVTLGPGDVYVQNGAMHNWRPSPGKSCHIVFIVLGAERASESQS